MVRRCYLQARPRRSSQDLGARRGDFPPDNSLELADRAFQIVVDDRVGELAGELALLESLGQPLLDLALAFGSSLSQAFLELLAVRGGDEDRDAAWYPVANGQRTARLELEQDWPSLAGDPLDLRPERPRTPVLAPGPLDPFEELVGRTAALELIGADEVVLAAVLLSRPSLACRRGNGQRHLRNAFEQHPRKGALPLAGGAGDDENGRAFTC